MSSSIFLIILGILLILLALASNIGGHVIVHLNNKPARWLVGLLGMFLFIVGIYLMLDPSPSPVADIGGTTEIATPVQSNEPEIITSLPSFTSPEPSATDTTAASTPPPTETTQIPSPTLSALASTGWYVPSGWDTHTEYASCPGYPSVQQLEFIELGVVGLTSEAANTAGEFLEWCFTMRFTEPAWWRQFYIDNEPDIFGTTGPESLAVYFRDLRPGMRIEVGGVQVLPAGPGVDGVSLINSPVTFHVFIPAELLSYQFESGPYASDESAVVIP